MVYPSYHLLGLTNASFNVANALWDTIDFLNQSLAKALLKLSEIAEQSPDDYSRVVKYLASLQNVQWLAHPAIPAHELSVIEAFAEVHQHSEVSVYLLHVLIIRELN